VFVNWSTVGIVQTRKQALTITLATTWQPRGETARFVRLRPQLEQVYSLGVVAVPADPDSTAPDQVRAVAVGSHWLVIDSPRPAWSRYLALQNALHTAAASHIHYADMDRLLRWVETRPTEWRQTVAAVVQSDCLIIGRTSQAFQTHPQALQQTEQMINSVFSHLLGQVVDLGGGSRGFSRRSAHQLISHSAPGPWEDARWPLLLHQAGVRLDYLAVDGLDWESADRHQPKAATTDLQQRLAAAYDADPHHWARRVQIALQIVEAGLAVGQ
jgi:hypothetical protein